MSPARVKSGAWGQRKPGYDSRHTKSINSKPDSGILADLGSGGSKNDSTYPDKLNFASKAWDAVDADRGIARVNRATRARAFGTCLRTSVSSGGLLQSCQVVGRADVPPWSTTNRRRSALRGPKTPSTVRYSTYPS
jgi:hypothetical protein